MIRAYTPVSSDETKGYVDLIIKVNFVFLYYRQVANWAEGEHFILVKLFVLIWS